MEVFRLIDSEKATKEALPDIIAWLAKHEDATVLDAVEQMGLTMIPQQELEIMIGNLISKNVTLIKEQKEKAFGMLMGMIMREVRGRARTEIVSRILRDKMMEYQGNDPILS